jgi:flagellar hook protein FlgE
MKINWNLYNPTSGNSTITQLAESSGVGSTTQNGFAAGQISNVSLQNGGLLVASYSNGQTATIGQLALASIANPDTLNVAGNNYLQASATTATPSVGTAGSGARGQIIAGALESSTVDIAQEFTSLLTYERGYQANSRVITVSDQLMQSTVGLIQA